MKKKLKKMSSESRYRVLHEKGGYVEVSAFNESGAIEVYYHLLENILYPCPYGNIFKTKKEREKQRARIIRPIRVEKILVN